MCIRNTSNFPCSFQKEKENQWRWVHAESSLCHLIILGTPVLNFLSCKNENLKIFLGVKFWTSQILPPTQQSKPSRPAVYHCSQKAASIITAQHIHNDNKCPGKQKFKSRRAPGSTGTSQTALQREQSQPTRNQRWANTLPPTGDTQLMCVCFVTPCFKGTLSHRTFPL